MSLCCGQGDGSGRIVKLCIDVTNHDPCMTSSRIAMPYSRRLTNEHVPFRAVCGARPRPVQRQCLQCCLQTASTKIARASVIERTAFECMCTTVAVFGSLLMTAWCIHMFQKRCCCEYSGLFKQREIAAFTADCDCRHCCSRS